MTPNWAGPPTSGRRNLSYQPLPLLSPLVFLQKIGMQKENQNAVYSLISSRTRHLSVWNTYSRTRHQAGTLIAEPDTCLEHRLDSNNTYTSYGSEHPISVDPLPLPSSCNHPLLSEFLPFFCNALQINAILIRFLIRITESMQLIQNNIITWFYIVKITSVYTNGF